MLATCSASQKAMGCFDNAKDCGTIAQNDLACINLPPGCLEFGGVPNLSGFRKRFPCGEAPPPPGPEKCTADQLHTLGCFDKPVGDTTECVFMFTETPCSKVGLHLEDGGWQYPEMGVSCGGEGSRSHCGDGATPRHIVTKGDCYEFCSNNAFGPEFKGGIATSSKRSRFGGPSLLWPNAAGPVNKTGIANSHIEEFGGCPGPVLGGFEQMTVATTDWDYQNVAAWSREGACPVTPAFMMLMNGETCQHDDTQTADVHPVHTWVPFGNLKQCTSTWTNPDATQGTACTTDSIWNCPWENGCLQWNRPEGSSGRPITCVSPEGMATFHVEPTPGSRICRYEPGFEPPAPGPPPPDGPGPDVPGPIVPWTGTIPFQGGIAAGFDASYRKSLPPTILWPSSRGSYVEFSHQCENGIILDACDSTWHPSARYKVTDSPYQTDHSLSRRGGCPPPVGSRGN